MKDDGIDLDWLATSLFTSPAIAEYNKVKDAAMYEYKKVERNALTDCDNATEAAWDEYKKAKIGRDKYDNACDIAWAKYNKVMDIAWDEYNEFMRNAFLKLAKNQNIPVLLRWDGAER